MVMIGGNQYISSIYHDLYNIYQVLSTHMVMIGVQSIVYQVLSTHMVMIGVNQYISST